MCADAAFKQSDLAASLVYCIVDHLATNVYLSAKSHDISDVIVIGSFLAAKQSIRDQFKSKLAICSMFLKVIDVFCIAFVSFFLFLFAGVLI